MTIRLHAVKLIHTLVWAFFVACILAVPLFAWADMYTYAAVASGFVLFEVVVLLVNGWRCPLTGVAARYTDDRRDNFDIYLPEWLARHNKTIFSVLYVAGVAYAVLRWTAAR
ncbi:MAG TPA: hypothetical protein VNT75_25270 [Symbiobacteriaceae bacterium]|nr:hypothetical protein [Symbiobacteriaceae bacterium]